jgi:phenylacetate-coenzyme A ligase PaaK-like adenylate-forming protein
MLPSIIFQHWNTTVIRMVARLIAILVEVAISLGHEPSRCRHTSQCFGSEWDGEKSRNNYHDLVLQ